uniref:Uncharacterized protein n=1 Tax=Mandrillus leucophaeus TaxID=9568 RepID=A0A2K5YUF6_MANLE
MDRTETMFCGMEQILGKITTLLPEDKEESPRSNTSEYSLQEVVDDEVSGPSAWPTWPNPVSTKNRKISQARWRAPVIPATQEAEVGELLEPRTVSLGDRARLFLQKKKKQKQKQKKTKLQHRSLGVDPSPSCRSLCWKRKREWLDQSDEEPEKELAPEPEETWVAETLCGLKMKLKRRRVSLVLPEHHEAFNRLLGQGPQCQFHPLYNLYNHTGSPSWCFLACYLANDMEEDSETPKQNIIYFLYRKNRSQIPSFHKRRFQFFYSMRSGAEKKPSQKALFHKLRFQFFHSMRCRAWVSLEELEEIQAYDPEHWVWARDRA